MMLDRDAILARVSELLDRRPVRWGAMACDFDGRERTLEIFDADAREQRDLLRRLRPVRTELDEAAGGPLVFVFHTRGESRRVYPEVLDAWYRDGLTERVGE